MKQRVVITGVGCVTPLGATVEQIWERLVAGGSGVRRLSLFDADNFPVRIAAEVHDWDVSAVGEDPNRWQKCPRQTAFAIGAAKTAAAMAHVPIARMDPLRFGVYLGCGEPFEDFTRFTKSIRAASQDGEYQAERYARTAVRVFDPEAEREFEPHMPAAHLAALFDARGPNANCIAACVSGAQAIGVATKTIRRGEADVMLAGGAHSTIHPFGLTGFHRLSALSTRNDAPEKACRPFDRERDGFVVGEGAAVFVLEELQHALGRGADIWGEIKGYGSAQDAYRITDAHPEGRGTAAAIRRALKDAELDTDGVDYINAHGTGTLLNDRIETLAIKDAFGADAYNVPISSSKSMLGHATTASAAIEMGVCLMAIRFGAVPPTINYETPDPECDLDYVPNVARERSCNHILSNSIGFGGQNAALVISRYDERSTGVSVPRKVA